MKMVKLMKKKNEYKYNNKIIICEKMRFQLLLHDRQFIVCFYIIIVRCSRNNRSLPLVGWFKYLYVAIHGDCDDDDDGYGGCVDDDGEILKKLWFYTHQLYGIKYTCGI